MTTKMRSEQDVATEYRTLLVRVREYVDHFGGTESEADIARLAALRWCLGGCLDPYHPPECPGDFPSCIGYREASAQECDE